MSLLFRPNASRNEKSFTIFFMVSVGACIYGMSATISPTGLVREHIAAISLTLSLTYFLPLLLDRHPSNKVRSLGFSGRLLFHVGAFLIAYCIAFAIAAYSVPSIYTFLVGEPHNFSTTIEKKSQSAKGCKSEIKLEGIGYGISDKICVGPDFWEIAKDGDEVLVSSLKSAIGIKVRSIEFKREKDATKWDQSPY
jgi:hypothetical protein